MLNTCHGDLICSIAQRYEIVGTKEEFHSFVTTTMTLKTKK